MPQTPGRPKSAHPSPPPQGIFDFFRSSLQNKDLLTQVLTHKGYQDITLIRWYLLDFSCGHADVSTKLSGLFPSASLCRPFGASQLVWEIDRCILYLELLRSVGKMAEEKSAFRVAFVFSGRVPIAISRATDAFSAALGTVPLTALQRLCEFLLPLLRLWQSSPPKGPHPPAQPALHLGQPVATGPRPAPCAYSHRELCALCSMERLCQPLR